MRRLVFAAALCSTAAVRAVAQSVPGRDLLEFPIGTAADIPVLATELGDGLWNPATALLDTGRARVGVGALQTPSEIDLSAFNLGASVMLPREITAGFSVVQASVADLVATTTDPQQTGTISYNTTMVSGFAAHRSTQHVVTGGAIRYRHGTLDRDSRSELTLDVGVVVDHLPAAARLAASTFLWNPARATNERTSYLLGGDARVWAFGAGDIRAGYSFTYTERLTREHYLLLVGRLGQWYGRVGAARTIAYEGNDWRMRLGIGLRYARYDIGLSREESVAGIAPSYQFTLSSFIP